MGAPGTIEPPLIKATLDGNLEKLAFFLNQMWAHLDQYGPVYFDDVACVNAIVANVEGEAAECVTGLHDERVPELGDPNDFLGSSEPNSEIP